MKAPWMLLLVAFFALVGCGGGSGGGGTGTGGGTTPAVPPASPEIPMPITITPSTHVVTPVHVDGIVGGIVTTTPVRTFEVAQVCYSSERVGAPDQTRACAPVSAMNTPVTIPGTANIDQGNWFYRLTDGSTRWFNVDRVVCAGVSCSKVKDRNGGDVIKYGSYQREKITFVADRGGAKAVIEWGSNFLSGIVGGAGVSPPDVVSVRWNSDRVGWNAASSATGSVQTDQFGNLRAEALGLPNSDRGNFSFVLRDGRVLWLNLDAFDFPNAARIGDQIQYFI